MVLHVYDNIIASIGQAVIYFERPCYSRILVPYVRTDKSYARYGRKKRFEEIATQHRKLMLRILLRQTIELWNNAGHIAYR